MVSVYAKIKISSFRPKTMDYSSWFDFFESKSCKQHGLNFSSPKKVLRKVCHCKGNEKRNLMAFVSVA